MPGAILHQPPRPLSNFTWPASVEPSALTARTKLRISVARSSSWGETRHDNRLPQVGCGFSSRPGDFCACLGLYDRGVTQPAAGCSADTPLPSPRGSRAVRNATQPGRGGRPAVDRVQLVHQAWAVVMPATARTSEYWLATSRSIVSAEVPVRRMASVTAGHRGNQFTDRQQSFRTVSSPSGCARLRCHCSAGFAGRVRLLGTGNTASLISFSWKRSQH